MSNLVYCERCQTLLHTSFDISDPFILKTQLVMSHHALRGDGYALNVYLDRRRPTCPICGLSPDSSLFKGQPLSLLRRRLSCKLTLGAREMEFLKRHSLVHLRFDLRMMRNQPPSIAHYLFAHSALRHFALGGTLSLFNGAIGAIALANSETSQTIIQYLCEIVSQETGDMLHPHQIQADAFALREGSCVVVIMPAPTTIAGAYFVGIVTNATLEDEKIASASDKAINVLYFTLELAQEKYNFKRTMLGEWKHTNRKNYGYGPNPNLDDFVECVERVWISKIWE